MPTTYAHYKFGQNVLAKLPADIQSVIFEYPQLYYAGVHGPDLLFYYRPYSINPVNQRGYQMHHDSGFAFFREAADILNHQQRKKFKMPVGRYGYDHASLSYLYGFLTHFALDSVCHPYIIEVDQKGKVRHFALEAELDRFLMTRDGYNPVTQRITGHVHPRMRNAKVIARFFPGLTEREVLDAMTGFKFWLNLLVMPGVIRRTIFRTGLLFASFVIRDLYDKAKGLVIGLRPDRTCAPMINHLVYDLFPEAEKTAIELIKEFVNTVSGNEPWDERYRYDFHGEFH